MNGIRFPGIGQIETSLKLRGPWISVANVMAIHPIVIGEVFTKGQNCQPHGSAGGKFGGSPNSEGSILWVTWICVPALMSNHLIVKISGPIGRLNDFAIPRAMVPHC